MNLLSTHDYEEIESDAYEAMEKKRPEDRVRSDGQIPKENPASDGGEDLSCWHPNVPQARWNGLDANRQPIANIFAQAKEHESTEEEFPSSVEESTPGNL